MRSVRADAPPPPERPALDRMNAREMVFHCSATLVRLANTITAVPPHSDHPRRFRIPAPANLKLG